MLRVDRCLLKDCVVLKGSPVGLLYATGASFGELGQRIPLGTAAAAHRKFGCTSVISICEPSKIENLGRPSTCYVRDVGVVYCRLYRDPQKK